MMRKTLSTIMAGAGLLASTFYTAALDRNDLSPEARDLIPKGNLTVIELKDGSRMQGVLSTETESDVVLRVQQSGTIAVGRRVPRTAIASMGPADVAPLLAERLLEIKPDPDTSLTPDEYRRILALFAEFLEKARGADAYHAVRDRHDLFQADYERVQAGMEKVAGAWLPPVAASIKNFQLACDEIEGLERHGRFASDEALRRRHEQRVEQRRDIARRAPKLMADRLPGLLNARNFPEAVFETTELLRFWIAQVVASEGPARDVLRQMDFDFILNMLDRIMEHYRRAGRGVAGPPAGAPAPPEMVYIPGGYFLMGERTDNPQQDTFPMRLIYVGPFLIDRHEVSNADYRRFVEHVRQSGESWFEHPDAPPLKRHDARGWDHPALAGDRQPVVGVDWFDAFAYARWRLGRTAFEQGAMKRLPTEAEWERAARHTDSRRYPWGDASPDTVAINWPGFRREVGAEIDRQNPPPPPTRSQRFFGCVRRKEIPPPPPTIIADRTWDVDRLLPEQALQAEADARLDPPWTTRDVSKEGVFHMAGNAAEWIQDYYEPTYYRDAPIKDPRGPERGARRGIRGGSYQSASAGDLTAWRRQARAPGAAETGTPFIGFRCARSLELVKASERDRFQPPPETFDEWMEALRAADAPSGR